MVQKKGARPKFPSNFLFPEIPKIENFARIHIFEQQIFQIQQKSYVTATTATTNYLTYFVGEREVRRKREDEERERERRERKRKIKIER